MAFSLKKWITGQMESARLNDANDNWTAIEGAIDTLQTNASLQWTGDNSDPVIDIIAVNYLSLPNNCTRLVTVKRSASQGLIVFKADNQYGKVIMLSYFTTGITVYQLYNGTWTERVI